ncbi:MAG: hypothetical protein KDA63_04600, partial [Planctomycetales bacterium]|nr:hypothetical protein [Planctomycetales bacterium]
MSIAYRRRAGWGTRVRAPLGVVVCLAVSLAVALPASAADWPTYAHDTAHSLTSGEQLSVPLAEAWSVRTVRPPLAAWDEPATWDGWNKHFDLRNRVAFDKVLNVVAVGERVWFGSSVDDRVICLDAA